MNVWVFIGLFSAHTITPSTPRAMVKNARFFGQTVNISCFETPIEDLFGTHRTLGKVSHLPGLRPDAADSGDTIASRLRNLVPKVIQRSSNNKKNPSNSFPTIVQKLLKNRPTVFQTSPNTYLKVVQQLFKSRPKVFQTSSKSDLKVVEQLANNRPTFIQNYLNSCPKVIKKSSNSCATVIQRLSESYLKVIAKPSKLLKSG